MRLFLAASAATIFIILIKGRCDRREKLGTSIKNCSHLEYKNNIEYPIKKTPQQPGETCLALDLPNARPS